MKRKERISQLLQVLNEGLYGKQQVVALSLLTALAGESIFLLGPPGVAKSMVARRLKLAFGTGEAFEYLMSRFSTPDELFGPVSISKLKEADVYERCIEGYLPTATIVFLDEIWKAGPAIQNALLTVLNEKIYRNGRVTLHLPLKGLIAASNELPASGQGLDALWDRFLLRLPVTGIEDMGDFDRMITSARDTEPEVNATLVITATEYEEWQEQLPEVKIPYVVLEVIHSLKEQLEDYNHVLQNEDDGEVPLYISDRRWKKLVKLLRTSALLNESSEVHVSDCLLICHALWNETGQREWVDDAVQAAIRHAVTGYLLNMDGVNRELEQLKEELQSDSALREKQDAGLKLVDGFYYQVERVKMAGRLLLFAADYQALDDMGKLFYLHKDKYKSDCYILKKYDPSMRGKVTPNKLYSLRRGCRSVFINDYEYPMTCVSDATPLPAIEAQPALDIEQKINHISAMLDRVKSECQEWADEEMNYCCNHLFLTAKERKVIISLLERRQQEETNYRHELEELRHAFRKENKEYPDR